METAMREDKYLATSFEETSGRLPPGHFHYGWVIVAAGALVLFSCFGLARYAYAMLIPGMQAGLNLTYDQIGFIGTANFTGYLLSVLLATPVMRRLRPRKTIVSGLLLLSVCMLAISVSHGFIPILCLYMLVGMGGGFANIPMMALVTYWFRSEKRGKAAGLVIAGNGAGIVLAGFLVPVLNGLYAESGWRAGWLVLGLICLTVAAVAALLLRNHPEEMGLEPVGRPLAPTRGQLVSTERAGDGVTLVRLGLLYMAFGATFMIYGTFIVTTMLKEYGFSDAKAGFYWSWVGLFSLFSGVAFGALSDKIGRKQGLIIVFIVQSLAYLLAGLKLGNVFLVVSILLYGVSVFAIPAIMAAAVGDYLGLHRAAPAFATITLFFAFGQSVGPALAGIVAKTTNSFCPAYLVSATLTVAAALFAVKLPSPQITPSSSDKRIYK